MQARQKAVACMGQSSLAKAFPTLYTHSLYKCSCGVGNAPTTDNCPVKVKATWWVPSCQFES